MKNIIFIASLLVTITLGTVLSVGQKPAVPNANTPVPVKISNPVKSEHIELVVRHNPVGNGQYGHVTLKGAADGDMVKFKVRPKPLTQDVFGNVLIFSGTEKSYEVEVDVITWETKLWRTADMVVNFGQLPLPPPNPVDPPVPIDPSVSAPIDGDGFKVVIIHEASDTNGLTKDQSNAIYGKSMRDYLNSKCVLGSDGKTKEWRIFDKDIDASAVPQWDKVMKRERKSIPWIVISNGKTGFEGPLPATESEIMQLLNKYVK